MKYGRKAYPDKPFPNTDADQEPIDQARRLKELEQENTRLKRLVSELSLEKLVLKNIASGTSKPGTTAQCGGSCSATRHE